MIDQSDFTETELACEAVELNGADFCEVGEEIVAASVSVYSEHLVFYAVVA